MEYGSEFVDQRTPHLALPAPPHAKALQDSRPVSQASQGGRPRSAMTPPPKGAPPPSPFTGKALPAGPGGSIRPSSIALEERGSRPGSRVSGGPPLIPPTPPPGAAPPPDMAPPPPPPAFRAMAKKVTAMGALQKSVAGKPPALPPLQRVIPKNV